MQRILESKHDAVIFEPISDSPLFGLPKFIQQKATPAALIRWEENGGLYGGMTKYRALTQWCYRHCIAPITVDFAFFDHYEGFNFDLLCKNGNSGIERDWQTLPATLDYDRISGNAGQYIRQVRAIYHDQKSIPSPEDNYSVAAFLQSGLRRCNSGLQCNSIAEWVRYIHGIFGDDVIFKLPPSPLLEKFAPADGVRVLERKRFNGTDQLVRYNASLAVHADYVITNNSGVTNEFVVTNIPVLVTGKSFYSGKNVFEEIKEWNDLRHGKDWKPEINESKRSKYVHWFLKHQSLHREPSNVLNALIEVFENCLADN